jgi:multidrug resistance protein, MATE family
VTVMGTMMSVNTLVAHELGASRTDRIPHIVRQSLWKGAAVGLLAMVVCNVATLLFAHLSLPPEVEHSASMFVHVVSLGMPAFGCYRALYGYTTSINQTKPIMVIALLGLLFVVAANWLLVFGRLGLPRMGAVGCAVATAASMWLMLAAIVLWIKRAPAYRATDPLTRYEGPHWPEIGPMLKLGIPIGITYLAEVSAFGLVGLLLAPFGVVQVAANQIALNFASLVFMVPLSFGIALITRVGQTLGEGDPLRARQVAWTGVGMSMAFAVLSALGILLFRWEIAAAYTSDPTVQALCVQLLMFAALFQLSDAAQVSASSAIRGYKVTREPMQIQVLAFWGLALPMGFVLGSAPGWLPFAPAKPMAAQGYWIALVLGLTVAAVMLCSFLQRLSRREAGPSLPP